MNEYLLVNSALSVISLVGLLLLRSTPPRVNMWVCLIALIAWIIPWQDISIGWSQPALTAYSTWAGVLESADAPLSVTSTLALQWSWVYWAATALGSVMFIVRWANLVRLLNRWRAAADPVPHLWQSCAFAGESIPIRVVEGFDNAFVSGYFNSEIWLGPRQAGSSAIGSILLHERTHIEQHDNFVLLTVALFRDLFWWNPLVWLLSHQARQYMELSCDQRCQKTSPGYQGDMARELLDVRSSAGTLGLMTPFFLNRRFNVFRIRQLDKEFSVKKRHLGLLSLMVLLGCSAALPAINENSSSEEVITNRLTIITVTSEHDQNEVVTEFIGEPEARKLLELAKAHAVDATSRMENDNRRIITMKSSSSDATYSVLTAFDGTPMEGVFRTEIVTELGEPLLIDLVFQNNAEEPFAVTLASRTGQWIGISRDDYLLRVKPTLISNGDREDVSFWVEVSKQVEGSYEVVARPKLITRINEVATIKSGDEQSMILLTLKARKG
ncbi:MAG: M56 family metallopeptidase [Gammaproteobacteria bacterium]|nr:M56 family metallopeptidase [Gammaproteobacteria bacterium]